jgi:asparagine synthase (glutamine-hydrolysing)
MCGIAGIIRFDGNVPDVARLERMTAAQAPRGPDGMGVLARQRVALGHRRLKIIDLSNRAQQPMSDPELGLDIVFNGCIYNYQALRAELEGLGYRFFSRGDTEVVLKALHAWGPEAVERFNGMFAFACHDQATGRVLLARDRLGIKPLYLSQNGDELAFASTLPALLAGGGVDTAIDPIALNYYLSFHAVVPAPHTLLQGVRKLSPGTLRIVEADGSYSDKRYWQLRVAEDPLLSYSEQDWEEQLLEAMRRAVRRRMVADVPVGVLLSGGVDSSFIVGLLAEEGQQGLNTFSVGFETVGDIEGNEFRYSDLVAERFATAHHKIPVPTPTLLDSLPQTIAAMSEPMVSHDNVGFYLLSQEVAKHLKVVQSGQGADEIFAGYHWYPPMQESVDPAADYLSVFADRDFAEYGEVVQEPWIQQDFARAFIEQQFGSAAGDTALDRALSLDTRVMLVDDPVKRVDNMTMAAGLEARVPFLDHEVVELAARIPAALKLADGGKGILKSIARRVIPAEVIDRPKGYFPVPELTYIRGRVYDYVRDALGSERARQRGLYNQAYVDRLMAAPEDHITRLGGSKLWQIALLELWLQAQGV